MNKTFSLNIENFFIKLFEDLKSCLCIEPDIELSMKNNFCETMNQDRINQDRMNQDRMNQDRMNQDRMNQNIDVFHETDDDWVKVND